ncbi:MAG TPA: AAA family ATPase [Kineosporiaceae bacterium]|nr:AAA family ATPase [Kineosporiaceae bacterium]
MRSDALRDVERRSLPADVARARERRRRQRLVGVLAVFVAVAGWPTYRVLIGRPVPVPSPASVDPIYLMSGAFFLALIVVLLGTTVVSGRSPHLVYRADQIDVRMTDVVGIDPVREDVVRSLDLFLAGRTFRREMGGTPRRGLLFEGPPGTGKTHLAKAMAAEAGVPFLYVSATAFQSMYYGATARKIRSYFRALRRAARAEGGAIGFIEEIDAIATTRGGLAAVPPGSPLVPPGAGPGPGTRAGQLWAAGCGGLVGLPALSPPAPVPALPGRGMNAAVTEGVGGVVNELLVQLQSFDTPTGWQRVRSRCVDALNLLLPANRQLPRPRPEPADILLIAATNRADSLDPALLRPGRFDRRLSFDPPDKAGRRQLVNHFLAGKAHEEVLDDPERRDALAGITQGYTPVMIEHLLDEALVHAVRRGAAAMSWADVEHARLVGEVGLGQPVGYTEREKQLIATHEAGHAVVAWLVAPERRLEILTIVKRGGALGLLAHGDREDVYTRGRRELLGLVRIALAGQVAEELFVGDVSTGPGGDLAYATGVAAQMVGQAGMAGSLVSFSAVQGSSLGDPGFVGRVLGDADARRRVEDLLREQRDAVRDLLAAHRHLVEALRDALMDHHELIGSEITDVLQATAVRTAVARGDA